MITLCDFAVPSGGSQKVAIEAARALAEAGVDVTFLHGVAGRDPRLDHPRIRTINLGLQDIWARPALKGAVSGIWSEDVRRRLSIELARLATDRTVVHLHQWTRAFSPSVFAAARESGLPFVVTAHDYFLACPNGVYFLFNRSRPCELTPLSPRCLVAPCDPKSQLFKAVRVGRSAATARAIRDGGFDVIHVSDRGQATLQPLLPRGVRHYRVDNPIEVGKGSAVAIAADTAFAYIGRLTREKGAVVAAAAAAAASVPIVFVGEGPAEAEIRAANPAAVLLGWRKPQEVAAMLGSRIRAVVAPSLWHETGPLTVAEAAARGVPAIASVRCGAAEKIVSGVTGLVVEPDIEALAGAMARLRDPAEAQHFGQAAYQTFWASAQTPEAHARALLELYGQMLPAPERADLGQQPA